MQSSRSAISWKLRQEIAIGSRQLRMERKDKLNILAPSFFFFTLANHPYLGSSPKTVHRQETAPEIEGQVPVHRRAVWHLKVLLYQARLSIAPNELALPRVLPVTFRRFFFSRLWPFVLCFHSVSFDSGSFLGKT